MSQIISGVVKNGVIIPKLPLPEGAQVEIHLNGAVPENPPEVQPSDAVEQEKARAAALERFLELARLSAFCSAGPYPTRDELHERP